MALSLAIKQFYTRFHPRAKATGFLRSEFFMKDKKTVIFLHVPKTAGTTLTKIILYQYEEVETWYIYKPSRKAFLGGEWWQLPIPERAKIAGHQFSQLTKSHVNNLKIIWGHINYGTDKYVDGPFTYISMLRNPRSRIISSYYYFKFFSQPEEYYCQLIRDNNLSCKDFVTSDIINDNMATRQLSGIGNSVDYGLVKREHLEIAKKNIEQHFSVVGLTERFDESLMLFKQRLGWKIPFYQPRNVNKKRPKKETEPEVIRAIERTNELDLELYEYVKERFEQQIEEGDIRRETARFKRFNYLYHTRPVSYLRRGLRKATSLISKMTMPK